MKAPNPLILLCLAVLPVVLWSCGSDSSDDEMSTEEQKEFVRDVMSDLYLYYDQIPDINLRDYDTPEAVLDALRVNPPDRFSYIADRVAQQNLFEEGTYEGIGYKSRDNEDNTETVVLVYNESAAGRPCPGSSSTSPCLRRGDIIRSSTRNGNTVSFDILREEDMVILVDLEIGTVQINTVLASDIQDHNGISVGYLAFSSFLEPSVAELNTAFKTFKDTGIDELVLDLRYNGGGRVSTAQVLASLIAGNNGANADVARLEWNDRNTQENNRFPFLNLANKVNLNRLYVLTLNGTASASELIINALEGIGVDVVTIGQTTHGKPVGSVGLDFADKTLNPITFSVVNDIGNGGYFNGIEATCTASDDTSRAFADPLESMYAAALYHIENSTCIAVMERVPSKHQLKAFQFNPDPMADLR